MPLHPTEASERKSEHAATIAFCIKEGAPADLFKVLDALTQEQRKWLFFAYCPCCAAADADCRCQEGQSILPAPVF